LSHQPGREADTGAGGGGAVREALRSGERRPGAWQNWTGTANGASPTSNGTGAYAARHTVASKLACDLAARVGRRPEAG